MRVALEEEEQMDLVAEKEPVPPVIRIVLPLRSIVLLALDMTSFGLRIWRVGEVRFFGRETYPRISKAMQHVTVFFESRSASCDVRLLAQALRSMTLRMRNAINGPKMGISIRSSPRTRGTIAPGIIVQERKPPVIG